MTIYVDAPRWEWQGHRWAHLVSDTDLDELHAFARRIGLRYLSFGLDHYDIAEFALADARRHGAVAVSSREVARRLVASGLRRRVGHDARRWRLVAAGDGPLDAAVLETVIGSGAADPVRRAADEGLAAVEGGLWRLLRRPGEAVAMLQWDDTALGEADHDLVATVAGSTVTDVVDRVVVARDHRWATVELVVAV